MKRHSLKDIAARVERLALESELNVCKRDHVVFRDDNSRGGESQSDDALPERCECGHPLRVIVFSEYREREIVSPIACSFAASR
jgi:hypothetical protein